MKVRIIVFSITIVIIYMGNKMKEGNNTKRGVKLKKKKNNTIFGPYYNLLFRTEFSISPGLIFIPNPRVENVPQIGILLRNWLFHHYFF